MSNNKLTQPELHEALDYFLYQDPANTLDRIRGIRKAETEKAERKKRGWSKDRMRAERMFNKRNER